MSRHRSWLALLAGLIVAVLVACTSTEPTANAPMSAYGSTPAQVLGPANKATGSPIRIGVASDGKTDALDTTPSAAAIEAVASYANDHLGGINGHPIEVTSCDTGNTPSGATNCATKLAQEGVAAILVVVSAQDGALYTAANAAGIPYVTRDTGTPDLLLKPGAFVLANPVASIGAGVVIAQRDNRKHAALVLPDVPAAAGAPTIAKPMFEKANVTFDMVPIPLQVADMTPQIQQAIGAGADLFLAAGTDETMTNAVKSLRQLGFPGTIAVRSSTIGPALVEAVPGQVAGIRDITTSTSDPNDHDVALFDAVMATYAPDTAKNDFAQGGFMVGLGLVRALTGGSDATDAASIGKALSSMPTPLPIPLGGGSTFQCGTKAVDYAPNICTSQVLLSTLDDQGIPRDYEVLDLKEVTKLS